MAIYAELFDGTRLEFPDGTDSAVIARVAKEQTAKRQSAAPGAAEAPAAEVPAAERGGAQPPSWAAEYPNIYKAAVATRQTIGPTVEMLGGIGGGAVGTVGATPGIGTLLGAGAGYAGAKQVLRMADQYLGLEPRLSPQDAIAQASKDIAMGATMEAGGRVAGQAISAGMGKLMDVRQLAQQRAAQIARQSVGGDVAAARAALAEAPEGATAAQALAGAEQPFYTTQALLQRAGRRAPEAMGPTTGPQAGMTPAQSAAAVNELAAMAGGPTATAARAVRADEIEALNNALLPQRNVVLQGINEAEIARRRLQGEAARMGEAAAQKVEDVRRFTSAENRALGRAAGEQMLGRAPMGARMEDLAERAAEVSKQAAEGSLAFGEASRFAQRALDSIKAHGLEPLKTDAIEAQLQQVLKNRDFAGNADIQRVIPRVIEDVRAWTDAGGVVDAFALDAIRRNSVSGAVRDLLGTQATPTAQKRLTADLLNKVKPAIDAAIVKASGSKAYENYLEAYAKGRQAVEQRELSAKALEMFETNPAEFVKLVRGKNPDAVEDIFGPGSYNIATQMSEAAMGKLGRIAETAERAGRATEQAASGQERLRELLTDNLTKWRVPWGLDVKAAATNKALDKLEQRLSKKVWRQLTESAQTAESFDALLSTLPASERSRILQFVKDPAQYGLAKGAAARAATNMLAPDAEVDNALAR